MSKFLKTSLIGASLFLIGLAGVALVQNLAPKSDSPDTPILINLFFGNSRFNPQKDCGKVFPVPREVPQEYADSLIYQFAAEQLSAGPTEQEKNWVTIPACLPISASAPLSSGPRTKPPGWSSTIN